jgi:hypothetical protein
MVLHLPSLVIADMSSCNRTSTFAPPLSTIMIAPTLPKAVSLSANGQLLVILMKLVINNTIVIGFRKFSVAN